MSASNQPHEAQWTEIGSGEGRITPRPRIAQNAWSIHVMLVDDDAADTSIVLDILARNSRVASAVGFDLPEKALAQLASGRSRPHLILLDINMPRMNGFKFLEALQEMPEICKTPVVLLTTSRFARDVEQARQTTACAYIVKPDRYEDLRLRLDSAVRQTISGNWSR